MESEIRREPLSFCLEFAAIRSCDCESVKADLLRDDTKVQGKEQFPSEMTERNTKASANADSLRE